MRAAVGGRARCAAGGTTAGRRRCGHRLRANRWEPNLQFFLQKLQLHTQGIVTATAARALACHKSVSAGLKSVCTWEFVVATRRCSVAAQAL